MTEEGTIALPYKEITKPENVIPKETKSNMQLTEKHRPNDWNGLVGEQVEPIKNLVLRCKTIGAFLILLFTGPPGTGKTTIAKTIANDPIFDDFIADPLVINASDYRGIDFVRSTLKSNLNYVGIHIVILDEADSQTIDAQNAMRSLIENKSPTVLLIIIGNDEDKIIDAIKSRCAHFRFTPLTNKDITKRLRQIADAESLVYKPGQLETIAFEAKGDMRKAINILETVITPDNKLNVKSRTENKQETENFDDLLKRFESEEDDKDKRTDG